MRIWYLAHPVAADERYTIEQNAAHTVKVMRILIDGGFMCFAPWHTHVLAMDDTDPEHRRKCIEADHQMLPHFYGIILTGHRISRGMYSELLAATNNDLQLVSAVGIPDRELVNFIRRHVGELDARNEEGRTGRT